MLPLRLHAVLALTSPLVRKPIPILDNLYRVLSVCSGQPHEPDWQTAINECGSTKLAAARRQCEFADDALHHCPGDFAAMAIGVSYGGGQQALGNLVHSDCNKAVLEGLLQEPWMHCIVHFGSGKQRYAIHVHVLTCL